MNYLVIGKDLAVDAVRSAVVAWPGARAEIATVVRENDEALSAARTLAAVGLRRVALVWSPDVEMTDDEDTNARGALDEVGSTDAALFSLLGAARPAPIPESSPFVEWKSSLARNDEVAQYGPHAVGALAAAGEFVQQPTARDLLAGATRWIDAHPGMVLATLNPPLGVARAAILAALAAAPMERYERAYIVAPKSSAIELAVRDATADLLRSGVSVLMVGPGAEISAWPQQNSEQET